MPEPIQFTGSSPRFSLPFLFAGQSQKEFFVNEAFARTDMLLHSVIEGQSDIQPSAPLDGEAWLIGDAPAGEWAARSGQIAAWQAGTWIYADPVPGMRIWDKSAEQQLVYSNGWQRAVRPASPTSGTTEDSELRAAFAALLETLAKAGIIPIT